MDGTDEARTHLPATWRHRYCGFPPQHHHGLKRTPGGSELVASFKREPDEADVLGIHLEGPYINAEYKGAQYGPAIREADLEELKSLFSILGDKMRLVTLAPETPGAMGAIDWLVERDIPVAIGHSAATYEEATAAIRRGANHGTHLYNGMRGLHHREPGVARLLLNRCMCRLSLI